MTVSLDYPITFWVDNATPLRYRSAIQEGILRWNPVFERVGFKDAVKCEIKPAEADGDPADMRHNAVRWMSSPGARYAGAFAQATLRGLAAKISTSEKRAHDPVTAAHLTETRVRIARFLHAQAIA